MGLKIPPKSTEMLVDDAFSDVIIRIRMCSSYEEGCCPTYMAGYLDVYAVCPICSYANDRNMKCANCGEDLIV